MSSNTARVMSVSLDQLEKSEAKMRSTERQRAKTQSNNAYCLLAALEQSYANYIPDIEQISKLTEEDSWNEVKANLVFLEQAARNFREIQNIHERLLRKTETAIRHAQKNVGKSLRRSVRIRDIKEAREALG
jgi:16S rRNA U1498 N3-methylase RsmE